MFHLPLFLLQIGVILIAARLIGRLFRRIRQQQVIGEMAAGVLLGPSFLGWIAPNLSASLFPASSLGFLSTLSNIGLLVFMFLVGVHVNVRVLRDRKDTAVLTSHVSVALPFLLGSLLALFLYPRLSDSSVSFAEFALFLGVSMSVTAFPVLARILTERNMLNSKVGSIAIACAAVDDVTAWCLLAAVVAMVHASGTGLPIWATLAGTATYGLLMITVGRRLLRATDWHYQRHGKVTHDLLALILLFVIASAYITEWLGIHALFGAFLLGVIMPRTPGLVRELSDRLQDMTVVLFLPLFFALTGLRTSVWLVQGSEMWLYCGLVILVAIAGKVGGALVASRLTGLTWRESAAVGVLMNTRGLIQLVVLNIGLDLGVISEALFTMLVLMALITTFMTAPLLHWVYPERFLAEERNEKR